MNSREQSRFDMIKRVGTFGTNNLSNFTGMPNQLVLDLTTPDSGLIDQIANTAGNQQSGTGEARGGTTSKAVLRDALLLELRGINRTAVAIAEATNRSEIMDSFRMPYGVSEITLIARARAMADAAEPMAAEFLDYAHGTKFVTDLRNHITAFASAEEIQETGEQMQAGATASLGPLLREAMTKVKQLDAFMHNFYKDNAEKMGEWKTASHVERQAKRKKQPEVPQSSKAQAPEMPAAANGQRSNGSSALTETRLDGELVQ